MRGQCAALCWAHTAPRGVQDLCCVVSTLAALQEVGFNADVQGCLVAAKHQLQHRFQQGRDVSVPTLCQVAPHSTNRLLRAAYRHGQCTTRQDGAVN